MEKRALIAVILSIIFFYGYSALFPPPKKDAPAPSPQQAVTTPAPAATQATVAAAPPLSPVPTAAVSAQQKEIAVEAPDYTAVFSTQGGSLTRLVLKKYRETADHNGKPVTLVDERDPSAYTLSTRASGIGLDPSALFVPSTDSLTVGAGEKKELAFTWISPAGVTVRKVYTFQGGNYGIDMTYQATNSGTARVGAAFQTVMTYPAVPRAKESRLETFGPVTFAQDKLAEEKIKDLVGQGKSYSAPLWSGFADKYFLSAVVAQGGSIASAAVRSTPRGMLEDTVTAPETSLNPGESKSVVYRLYFGPKDLDILKAQGNSLERAINLGWFAMLAKPLLHSLKFFYKYVHNYGIAIIIITVILKILFYPLTHSSYKSMKQMQKLQPKMQEVREKYKNDRDAMNKAIMELYQAHKVNPVGGCLPMLVQIPVFFALYKALMFSIELRHAPFMLWIQDLAGKDPYYVTPIIMGITMVIQQKMTPSQMDPMQQKMMMALPVVFTFMFLNFPSGLVLYWLVNNVLTIVQQSYINKSIAASEAK
ncbi:membrane protein insertase YidC [Geobacter hydrogenophilus]|uniref:Membrane protein insertase YidC n=1 Tax=Geobacter hydrogenophilus TaxID=40983 RepID=A0A9W6G070_9BACT|nr:membrane protein insertase YidC [Geobacter hydrogenophilus]MBT0894036.1 membrane protein insertase YidC [Geobacter hydrogenophilus]GLI38017.1 membrane protein insertase YidC [Geobacter hydrogenophilus]